MIEQWLEKLWQKLNNMNDKPFQLDKWDYKFIKIFKWAIPEDPTTPEKLKEIWAKRCNLAPQDTYLTNINNHLLELAHKLNLFANPYIFKEFIFHLDPLENRRFMCTSSPYLKRETNDYNLILLSRLGSLFALTEVKDLPGYRELWEKEDRI